MRKKYPKLFEKLDTKYKILLTSWMKFILEGEYVKPR
jgi:hypothetical protein